MHAAHVCFPSTHVRASAGNGPFRHVCCRVFSCALAVRTEQTTTGQLCSGSAFRVFQPQAGCSAWLTLAGCSDASAGCKLAAVASTVVRLARVRQVQRRGFALGGRSGQLCARARGAALRQASGGGRAGPLTRTSAPCASVGDARLARPRQWLLGMGRYSLVLVFRLCAGCGCVHREPTFQLRAAGADARARAVHEHAVTRASGGAKLCNDAALGEDARARPCSNLRSAAGRSAFDARRGRLRGPRTHGGDAPRDCSACSCVCHARTMARRGFGSRLPWSLSGFCQF